MTISYSIGKYSAIRELRNIKLMEYLRSLETVVLDEGTVSEICEFMDALNNGNLASTVKVLYITNSSLESKATRSIVQCLSKLSSLEVLCLNGCTVPAEMLRLIVDEISKRSSLLKLRVEEMHTEIAGLNLLEQVHENEEVKVIVEGIDSIKIVSTRPAMGADVTGDVPVSKGEDGFFAHHCSFGVVPPRRTNSDLGKSTEMRDPNRDGVSL